MDANNVILTLAVALIASAPGGLALLIQWRRDKRTQPIDDTRAGIQTAKDAADTVKTYAQENRELNRDLDNLRSEFDTFRDQTRKRINILEDDLARRDALIAEWSRGISRLVAQMKSVDMTPVWQPKE